MRIQHNITAMNAYRNYNNNTSAIGKNLEKLSSGYKINRAGDDAAGLAVSQKMRLQIAGLAQAQKNAKSGISYVQTAEGALQEVHEMLERMYTLAEQSANGTFDSSTDRTQLQKEVNSLMEEINRIGRTANFNGMGIFKQYVKPGATTTTDPTAPTTIADNTNSFTAAATLPEGVSEVKATDATKLAAGDVKVKVEDVTGAAAKKASFEVDLATVTGVENGKSYKLTIGGVDIESGNAGGTTANDLASAFATKTAKIGGVDYTISATGSKIKFEATTAGAATALADNTAVTLAKGTTNAPASDPTATGLKTAGKADGTAAVQAGKNVTITNGTNTDTINIATADWKDTVTVNSTKLGISFKYDTTKTSLDAEKTIGTVTANNDTPPATESKKYESTITGGDGKLAAGDTIKIGGKTYTLATDNNGDNISVGANDTFEKQIKAAIEKYNAVTTEDFTAAYADGKVTFTPKEGKTPTAAPTFEIGDAAKKISASAPTEVQENGNDSPGTISFWIGAEAGEDNKLTIDLMSLEVGDISIADPAYIENKTPGVKLNGKVKTGDISGVDITDANKAMTQLSVIKQASDSVSNMRGTLGAMQNRLDHTLKNLSVMQENMQDAESVIRDTDVAEEMMAYTKNSILVQSAQAMLAQANQLPQGVLQLLQ